MSAHTILPPENSGTLLRLPSLKAFLFSRSLAALASQMMAVAVGWQIYALTHSIRALGFVGLAQFAPMLFLVFIAGHFADRHDRRMIVMVCQALECAALVIVALGSAEGWIRPWMLYALVAIFGALRTFEMPCQQTFVAAIAPSALLPRATALSSSLFTAASVIGPSLGGVLYGLGPTACYAICAVSFGLACAGTVTMKLSWPTRVRNPVSLASVFGGVTYLRRRPDTLGAISLDLFAVLLGGATAMLPVYANDILRTGPLGLGLLRAAPAIGALLTSTAVARWPLRGRCGPLMFLSVAIFGVATIVFGLSTTVWISVLALMVLGAADVISVMVRGALVQLGTPDEMRGRVSAVNTLFIGSSNQLGELESGLLGSAIGPEAAVVIGGIGTILVAGIWVRLFPGLWRLDRLEDIEAH